MLFVVRRCLLLFVVCCARCVLLVVCCLLCVVCCLSFDVLICVVSFCRLLLRVLNSLFVARCCFLLSFVVVCRCGLLVVVCCLLFVVVRCVLFDVVFRA